MDRSSSHDLARPTFSCLSSFASFPLPPFLPCTLLPASPQSCFQSSSPPLQCVSAPTLPPRPPFPPNTPLPFPHPQSSTSFFPLSTNPAHHPPPSLSPPTHRQVGKDYRALPYPFSPSHLSQLFSGRPKTISEINTSRSYILWRRGRGELGSPF